MKIRKAGLHFFALLCTLTIVACGGIKKMHKNIGDVEITTEPEVLEVHGDSVEVTIKGEFPPKYFDKNAIMKFDPTIGYGKDTQTIEVEPFYLKGEKVKVSDEEYNVVKTISYENGGSFEKTIKFPYKPEMKNSNLEAYTSIKVDSDYDELDKCYTPDEPEELTEGTITTSLTVKPTDRVIIACVNDQKKGVAAGSKPGESGTLAGQDEENMFKPKAGTRYPESGVVSADKETIDGTIFFEINRSYIRSSEKKSEDVKAIKDFVDRPRIRVRSVVIESYASPDGELELNANLTNERAENTFDYLKSEFKRMGIEEVHDSDFLNKASTKEDWDGFKKLVKQSDLDDKNEILSIANSDLPLDEKEAAIRKLPSWEPYMVDTLLPKLRRSEIRVIAETELRSLDSIRAVAEREGYDSLSKRELIKLSYSSNDIDEKREIYEHFTEKYPEDWMGWNNLGALLIFEARFEEANEAFQEYDRKYPENPTIKNNLGVTQRFLREYDSARENYTYASRHNIDESNNLGILDIKVGDYDGAVGHFENDRCDYNVALAYTLKEDYEKAKEKIECIVDKTADVYYLRAIIGARTDDVDLITTSLRRAVEMDSSIRERAENDLEFRKYWDDQEFQNALR